MQYLPAPVLKKVKFSNGKTGICGLKFYLFRDTVMYVPIGTHTTS